MMVYRPSTSADLPIRVPVTKTLAPANGSCVSDAVMTPVMVADCAAAFWTPAGRITGAAINMPQISSHCFI